MYGLPRGTVEYSGCMAILLATDVSQVQQGALTNTSKHHLLYKGRTRDSKSAARRSVRQCIL